VSAPIVVGLISDTHGLLRPAVHDALAGLDLRAHAGDAGGGAHRADHALTPPVPAGYGNPASTTLFVALHRYLTEGGLHAGDRILLLSVASGLQIGVVLFELDELEVSHGLTH